MALIDSYQPTEDFYPSLRRSSIHLPASNDYSVKEKKLILANRKTAKEEDPTTPIQKEDFPDGGKYANLFIPKYPCVPTQIIIDSWQLSRKETHPLSTTYGDAATPSGKQQHMRQTRHAMTFSKSANSIEKFHGSSS